MTVNPKQAFGDKKVPLGFVPPAAIIYMGLAMADGARKYGPYNWRDKPIEAMTYIHAALRHIYEYLDGVDNASDSGKPHLAHALACLGLLADATEHGNLIDNRPLRGPASALLTKHEKPVPLSPRIEESLNAIEKRTPACPDLDQELPLCECQGPCMHIDRTKVICVAAGILRPAKEGELPEWRKAEIAQMSAFGRSDLGHSFKPESFDVTGTRDP